MVLLELGQNWQAFRKVDLFYVRGLTYDSGLVPVVVVDYLFCSVVPQL